MEYHQLHKQWVKERDKNIYKDILIDKLRKRSKAMEKLARSLLNDKLDNINTYFERLKEIENDLPM